MKILLVTDIDNPGLKEDCMIARSFINDGHKVTIARQDYDEKLDDMFDLIIIRNIWHLDNDNYEEHKQNIISLIKRLKEKSVPTINLNGIFDTQGKLYLEDLYKKGYPVIPSSTNIQDFLKYNDNASFLLKPLDGYDGYGIIEKEKRSITNDDNYLIQPKIGFSKEIEFYFLNKEFQYVLEFVPSKKPVYPIPNLYSYTEEELKIAQSFANQCGDDFCGVQRIDFLKTDNELLLLEIGDSAPYLNLSSLDDETRNKFINNYKKMVYDYYDKITNN